MTTVQDLSRFPQLVIPECRSFRYLLTKIRDSSTSVIDFRHFSDRLMRVLCEEGIATINANPTRVITPTMAQYDGVIIDESSIVVVSIIRAGGNVL